MHVYQWRICHSFPSMRNWDIMFLKITSHRLPNANGTYHLMICREPAKGSQKYQADRSETAVISSALPCDFCI